MYIYIYIYIYTYIYICVYPRLCCIQIIVTMQVYLLALSISMCNYMFACRFRDRLYL